MHHRSIHLFTHTHTHTHTDRVHHSRGQPIRHHASVYEQEQTDSRAIAQMEVARRDRAIISRLDPLALAPAPARSVIGAGFFQHGADQPLSLCLLAHLNPLPANLTHLLRHHLSCVPLGAMSIFQDPTHYIAAQFAPPQTSKRPLVAAPAAQSSVSACLHLMSSRNRRPGRPQPDLRLA